MNISVCLVAPLPPPYGGISHWATLIGRYAANKEEVDLSIIDIAPRWRETHQKSKLVRAFGGAVQLIRDSWRFIKTLYKSEPSVVHLTTSGGLAFFRDLLFVNLAHLFKAKVVVHIHYGRLGVMSETAIEFRLFRRVADMADRLIVIDKTTYGRVCRYFNKNKIRLIPNCVDFSSLPLPKSERKFLNKNIVFLGWVVETKGVEELLCAWRDLGAKEWNLTVIGPCSDLYKEVLISKYQCGNVRFVGELKHADAMSLMAECSVFVLPSYTEGFPNVVLEAMALGLPVVATSVGAIPEMLEGVECVLVPPRDTVALRYALEKMISDEGLRERAGSDAMAKAKGSYSLERVFDAYLAEWRSLQE